MSLQSVRKQSSQSAPADHQRRNATIRGPRQQLLNNTKQTQKLITKNSRTVGGPTVGGPLPPVGAPSLDAAATPSLRHCRSRCGLRSYSTSSMDYSLPRLRTKFGERAFSHAGPATWNALPDHIRAVADPVKFRKLLKSHYFSQAFNIC